MSNIKQIALPTRAIAVKSRQDVDHKLAASVDRTCAFFMLIKLSEDLPPTLNEQIKDARSGWRVSAGAKKIWTNRIAVAAWDLEKFQSKDKVWCEFHWYVKNFGRDADNVAAAAKYIFDGLVEAGTIPNDNLTIIQSPLVHYYHKGKSDRFELRLSNSPDFLQINSKLSC